MDELNAEVRRYVDEARGVLKDHFAQVGADFASELVGGWVSDGIYPFDEDDTSKVRECFDKAAIELAGRFESFSSLSAAERGILLKLLKAAMPASGKATLKSILS